MSDLEASDPAPRFDGARDLGELASVEADLVEVAAALRRLDEGSYGTCETCGAPIPAEVDADPLARRCPEHARVDHRPAPHLG